METIDEIHYCFAKILLIRLFIPSYKFILNKLQYSDTSNRKTIKHNLYVLIIYVYRRQDRYVTF